MVTPITRSRSHRPVLLALLALLPLAVITIIHFQLIKSSVDSEFLLRTERLTSNARRAVTYFLEERLSEAVGQLRRRQADEILGSLPDGLAVTDADRLSSQLPSVWPRTNSMAKKS